MRYSDRIGRYVRTVREAKGYSQEYMAEMLDMVQSSYANLESGKSNMTVDRLIQLCEILKIDVHQLLDAAGTPISKSITQESLKAGGTRKDIQDVYEQLIQELHSEIVFLRHLVQSRGELTK